MSTPRRAFLGRLTAGAVAAVALPATPSLLRAELPDAPEGPGPFGELDALRSGEIQPAATWDTSWTKRITGKHKAVFDTPELEEGSGVFRSGLWLRQYADVFKLQPSELTSVLVIRHSAIPLVMNQAFWDEYEIGKRNKLKDEKGKKTNRNPVLLPESTPASFAALALDKQIASGTIVLACDMAFRQMVSIVGEKHKLKGAEARAKALTYMLPGVIMQPSGFFATTLAGENGCVYVRAA